MVIVRLGDIVISAMQNAENMWQTEFVDLHAGQRDVRILSHVQLAAAVALAIGNADWPTETMALDLYAIIQHVCNPDKMNVSFVP